MYQQKIFGINVAVNKIFKINPF